MLIFKSYDELDVDARYGVEIYTTKDGGLCVVCKSAYLDEPTTREYIEPGNPDFNQSTDWTAMWNDTTLTWQAAVHYANGISEAKRYRKLEQYR
jgi:hypothetical protein